LTYKKEFVGNLQEEYIKKTGKKILSSNEISTKVLNIIDGFKILIDNICLIHSYVIKSNFDISQSGGMISDGTMVESDDDSDVGSDGTMVESDVDSDVESDGTMVQSDDESVNNILDQLTTSLLTVDVISVDQSSDASADTVTDASDDTVTDEDALFDKIESPEDLQIVFSIENLKEVNIKPESKLDFNKICADRFYNIGDDDINEMTVDDLKNELQTFNEYIKDRFSVPGPIGLDFVFDHIFMNIVSDIPPDEVISANTYCNKVVDKKNIVEFNTLFGNPNHLKYFVNYINNWTYHITIFTHSQIANELNDLKGKWAIFHNAYQKCLDYKTEYDAAVSTTIVNNHDKIQAIYNLINCSIIVRKYRDVFFRERWAIPTKRLLRPANIWDDIIKAYTAVRDEYSTRLANLEGGKRTRKNRKSPNKSTRKNTKAIPRKRKYTKRNRKQTKTKTHKRKP